MLGDWAVRAGALASSSSGSDDDAERSAWLSSAAVEGPELLRRFAAVSDGRGEQGRDHLVAVVLTLCAAAVLGGMRSFTAIAGWVADVPAEVLARLYAQGRSKTILERPWGSQVARQNEHPASGWKYTVMPNLATVLKVHKFPRGDGLAISEPLATGDLRVRCFFECE